MTSLLWLIPILPFIGFLVLALAGARLPRKTVAMLGMLFVALSTIVALLVAVEFFSARGTPFTQTLWTWFNIGGFTPTIAFTLDALSLLMVLVVTVVATLILLYSTRYMRDDEGYHRFFAYMNLFVGSMLVLVLADNYLLLYLGWEGVGLCSYLLIGFWYKEAANVRAAMKAFLVTRIGDAALAVGLIVLVIQLGTLQFSAVPAATENAGWAAGMALPRLVAALLLIAAVAKSAQLPLQVWLPDAMAGPTPVSALIHAATMVTAGVYLIARSHELFSLAPTVMLWTAIIGAATLLFAGFSALAQYDLKRILAYSTISQLGYMFLALGVGAWSAAMFHFMTHAFFKALLFLAAGVVILSLQHEQNVFRMGGLAKKMQVTYWTFLVGVLALSSFPLITSGFYSKDVILLDAWASEQGSPWLWGAGLLGAFLTSLYSFRMLFLVFYGKEQTAPSARVLSPALKAPLLVLAFFAATAGLVEFPHILLNFRPFAAFLGSVLPEPPLRGVSATTEWLLLLATTVAELGGIGLAYWLFRRERFANTAERPTALQRVWLAGWGFDALYHTLIVRPYIWLAHINRHDVISGFYQGLEKVTLLGHRGASRTQTGMLRWYVAGIAIGAVLLIALLVKL